MFQNLLKRLGYEKQRTTNLTDEARNTSINTRRMNSLLKAKQREIETLQAYQQMRLMDDQLDREREKYAELFETDEDDDDDEEEGVNAEDMISQTLQSKLFQMLQQNQTQQTSAELQTFIALAKRVDVEKLSKLLEKHKLFK